STTYGRRTARSAPRSSCSRSRSDRCSGARRRRSVAAQGRSGSGRRALGRVVLVSLADRARAELDERRARGQRLRAHRALRRLEELERALDRFDRGAPPLTTPWFRRRGALAVAVAVLVVAAGA